MIVRPSHSRPEGIGQQGKRGKEGREGTEFSISHFRFFIEKLKKGGAAHLPDLRLLSWVFDFTLKSFSEFAFSPNDK